MAWYRRSVVLFAITFVALGVALVAKTAATDGGSSGYVIGVLFAAVGVGRLYLLQRR